MSPAQSPFTLPALLTVGGVAAIVGAIMGWLGYYDSVVKYLLFEIGVASLLFAWFYIYPAENRRLFEENVSNIKQELNAHPRPIVEFERVLTEEYQEKIDYWRKLRPGLTMHSGPLSKLILRPNPPHCGYHPLEIWYRIDDDPHYKRFRHIPIRGLRDGDPPIFWVVEVQSADFHREFIRQVHFAFRYGHLNGRDCIYIIKFEKTVGTIAWTLDRESERFYLFDRRLGQWYRALPPAGP